MSKPTALEVSTARHADMLVARRTADNIVNLLRRFIPDACLRDAHMTALETVHEHGIELTDRAMRREYEAMKLLTLAPLGIFPPDPANKVTVTISGAQGAGKTRIGDIVRQALRERGAVPDKNDANWAYSDVYGEIEVYVLEKQP